MMMNSLSTPSAFRLTCGCLFTVLRLFVLYYRAPAAARFPSLMHSLFNPSLRIVSALSPSVRMPRNCFKRPVFHMKMAAFLGYGGCVNIFFHSTTQNGSLRLSSLQVSLRSRMNFRHSMRIGRLGFRPVLGIG